MHRQHSFNRRGFRRHSAGLSQPFALFRLLRRGRLVGRKKGGRRGRESAKFPNTRRASSGVSPTGSPVAVSAKWPSRENYWGRFNHAFGLGTRGFPEGSYCAVPETPKMITGGE